LIVETGMYRRS